MKIKALLFGAVLVLSVSTGGVVFAQETRGPDSPTSDQVPADRGTKKTREQRVADRKAKSERRLTQFEINQVKFRCQAATGLVKSAQARIGSFEAKRTKVYSGVVTKLNDLSPKLQAAGVETATYNTQVAELKAKAEAYDTDITALKQAVDDLAAVDCAADPEGFVATLLEAHKLRQGVIEKGKDFRTYLRDTLRPTLIEIRKDMNTTQTESEE